MEYNEEQLEVINSEEAYELVRAPAGSGKTACLLGAIVKYRQDNPTAHIDAITFTRAATAELRERLNTEGIYDVNISTIHVWARNNLQDLADLYHFHINVLEQPQIKEILRGIIAGYRKKVDLQTLYDFILENKRLTISEISKRTYEALERRYVQYKRSNYLYDYTDYPLYLYNELNKYGEKIYNTDALFVDELQDVDAEQFHIFDLVEAHKKFYIGDSKQMIYAFRGASPHIFEEVQGFYEYTLHNNYRSKQEIIDYAVTIYNTIQEQLDKGDFNCTLNYFNWSKPCDIKCIRGNCGKVFVANSFGQVNLVNGEIQNRFKCIQEFLMLHPMILCRTNREVSILNSYGYYDCSTIHKAKGLEFNNVVVLDMDIDSIDDLNVAYVGLTRARDNLLVIGIQQLIQYL